MVISDQQGSHDEATRDPIEWAILAVVVGGASLLLSLETKVQARRRAESEAAGRKAQGGNRARLSEMKAHIDEMRGTVSNLRELGRVVSHPERDGITKSSIEFESPDREAAFNQLFDRLTYLISRINRLLNEIDPEGLPLTDADVQQFVVHPIRDIERKTPEALQAIADTQQRLARVDDLLRIYSRLLDKLNGILAER